MERKEVEKAVRKISVFVLWLVALLAAIAVVLYRRIVVRHVREVVER